MIKIFAFTLILAVSGVVLLPQPASAHVLIRDETKSIGSVLHIVPDDDPIAGQPASIFFDIQTQSIDKAKTELTITSAETGDSVSVPFEVAGSSVNAVYTFPSQGAYRLKLYVQSDKDYTFSYYQRVSRGLSAGPLDNSSYPLANSALVFSGTMALFLAIIIFNRRKEIKEQSTF